MCRASQSKLSRRSSPAPVPHLLGLLVASWLAACTGGNSAPPPKSGSEAPAPAEVAQPKSPPPPDLRLVFMTDLQGYLEPCGCQKVPLGGIDRAAAKLAELRADGTPTVLLSAGALLAEPADAHPGAPEGGDTQEKWKAEVLGGILGELDLQAALPGEADARFGEAFRDGILKQAGIARLSADAPTRLLEVQGHKLGVWGARIDEQTDPGELNAQMAGRTQALRDQGAQLVVGLMHASVRDARRLAAQPGAPDLLVLGGLRRDEPSPPAQIEQTIVLTGGQHGRGLLVADLVLTGDGDLQDASAWTVEAEREALAASVDDLAERVADWDTQPDVDPKLLDQQKQRLARMRSELEALAPPVLAGRQLRARYVPLTPDVARDDATKQLMTAYDKRVNAHNRKAFADLKPKPAPEGAPHYVGSAQCGACHAPALAWWKKHPHGNAYATLQTRFKEYNLSCVGCHVTGYGKPGGSTVTHNAGLTNVGCESCHGPGSQHPQRPGSIVRAPQESTCTECHNEEHSDHFDFDTYRKQLIVPGHGLPASPANAKPAGVAPAKPSGPEKDDQQAGQAHP